MVKDSASVITEYHDVIAWIARHVRHITRYTDGTMTVKFVREDNTLSSICVPITFIDDAPYGLISMIGRIIEADTKKKDTNDNLEYVARNAVACSIAHWEKMLSWAKTQPQHMIPDMQAMLLAIGEKYTGAYCKLCEEYGPTQGNFLDRACNDCPLKKFTGVSCNANGSIYSSVTSSMTWGTWCANATTMINTLRAILANYNASIMKSDSQKKMSDALVETMFKGKVPEDAPKVPDDKKSAAIKSSIAHRKRMMDWVMKQPNRNEKPDSNKMLNEIDEDWSGGYCNLCINYGGLTLCRNCPLQEYTGARCKTSGSIYDNICKSTTWS